MVFYIWFLLLQYHNTAVPLMVGESVDNLGSDYQKRLAQQFPRVCVNGEDLSARTVEVRIQLGSCNCL